jgi:hypothetical protein
MKTFILTKTMQAHRTVAWWFAFSGIYAASATCPCCGRPSCPVSIAAAGLVGGALTFVIGFVQRFRGEEKQENSEVRNGE